MLMWPFILGPKSKAGLIHQWTPKEKSFMSERIFLGEKIHLMKNSTKFGLKAFWEGERQISCLKTVLNK